MGGRATVRGCGGDPVPEGDRPAAGFGGAQRHPTPTRGNHPMKGGPRPGAAGTAALAHAQGKLPGGWQGRPSATFKAQLG